MKLKYLLFTLSLTAMASLWSCGGEDEAPTENNVVLTVSVDNEFPLVGDRIKLTVKASSEAVDMTSLEIIGTTTDTTGAERELLVENPDVSGLSYEESFEITIPDILGRDAVINFEVTAKDGLNQDFTETATAEVSTETRFLIQEFRCDHRFSLSGESGIDLLTGNTIIPQGSAQDETWDFIDRSGQQEPLAKSFLSLNSPGPKTEFVDLGVEYDIETIKSGQAKVEFKNRSANTVISVTENSKVLAKVRGTENYAIIHVRSINTEGDEVNKGFYILDIYKFKNS